MFILKYVLQCSDSISCPVANRKDNLNAAGKRIKFCHLPEIHKIRVLLPVTDLYCAVIAVHLCINKCIVLIVTLTVNRKCIDGFGLGVAEGLVRCLQCR